MEKASAEVLTDVHLLKGKSYLALGRDTLGLQELNTTISSTQSAKAAEALFAIAEYKLGKGMDGESEACINRLIEEYQNYDYWVTRSFLLYAEVFLQRKDRFNAKETLQSVIDHSENTELLAQAKERLNALIAEEKAEEEKFKQDALEIRFDTNSINDNDLDEKKP
jgi:predicted negative regulator of RcsB-dependent stress response